MVNPNSSIEQSATPSETVRLLLESARVYLPIQNPLHSFVHNNILMSFEGLPFHRAVDEAGSLYGGVPYRDQAFYKTAYEQGRITDADLEKAKHVLAGQSLSEFSQENLRMVHIWEREHHELFNRRLHDFLIPLISTFLDQGLSHWPNPFSQLGLWNWFKWNITKSPQWMTDWFPALKARMDDHLSRRETVDELICKELEFTKINRSQWFPYVLELLFDLKGWSGIINKLEMEPEQAPLRVPRCQLRHWIAIRLICENAINEFMTEKHKRNLISQLKTPSNNSQSVEDKQILRLWHEAYEWGYYRSAMEAVKAGLQKPPVVRSEPPDWQIFFCMDDREKSLRCHLEKIDASCETIGSLGFFGIDMLFQAWGKSKPTIQCPPVIKAAHKVGEKPLSGATDSNNGISPRLNLLKLILVTARSSRSLFRGFAFSFVLGIPSLVLMAWRVFFPKSSAALFRQVGQNKELNQPTDLILDGPQGYTNEEQAGIVAQILRWAGITNRLSPVVVLLSHGSTTTNNPFRQSYGCGACSGNDGHPNSRAFAKMANNPEVRQILSKDGVQIPESTVFVAAHHDTCTDSITLLDCAVYTGELKKKIDRFRSTFNQASELNAMERSRLFLDDEAPSAPKEAIKWVQRRSVDLAQPRPEYGHCRVAASIVGRREVTQFIDLDHGVFLISYDSTTDSDGKILASLIYGSIPVCANINLDYYFSYVDNIGFGAGNKLPLNITGLLGVMTGSKSDLRIGLAKQMVEIHDAVRLLVFVEAEEMHLTQAIEGHQRMKKLVHNDWIRVIRIDPQTRELSSYTFNG